MSARLTGGARSDEHTQSDSGRVGVLLAGCPPSRRPPPPWACGAPPPSCSWRRPPALLRRPSSGHSSPAGPLISIFGAILLLGERPSRGVLVALPVVLLGVVLISGAFDADAYGDEPARGREADASAGEAAGPCRRRDQIDLPMTEAVVALDDAPRRCFTSFARRRNSSPNAIPIAPSSTQGRCQFAIAPDVLGWRLGTMALA